MSIILAFILGVCVMLVVGCLTVGVIAFFKVIKLNKESEEVRGAMWYQFEQVSKNHESDISNLYQTISSEFDIINKTIDSNVNDLNLRINQETSDRDFNITGVHGGFEEVFRTIDSRYDKLENKISNLVKEKEKNN
jgi:hypothetical protein